MVLVRLRQQLMSNVVAQVSVMLARSADPIPTHDRSTAAAAFQKLAVMQPRVSPYLLDADGKVLYPYDTPTKHISLPPIQKYLSDERPHFPLWGDDPAHLRQETLFAAAPLRIRGSPGYVYLTIDGSSLTILELCRQLVREGPTVCLAFLASAVIAIALGAALLRFWGRRFLRLTTVLDRYATGSLSEEYDFPGNDDISAIGREVSRIAALGVARAEQLAQARKTRGELLLRIVHDLQGPVAGLTSGAETLESLSDVEEKTGRHRILAAMEKAIEAHRRLLTSLEPLATPVLAEEKIHRETFSLVDVIETLLLLEETAATAKGVTLNRDYGSGEPFIDADRSMIERIVANLVRNAIRFTHCGGWVRVDLRFENDSVHCSVVDNGAPIPHADLPYLFEPFYRANNQDAAESSGTGLGLSTVKKLVEMHGGTVHAESSEAATAISFTLPRDTVSTTSVVSAVPGILKLPLPDSTDLAHWCMLQRAGLLVAALMLAIDTFCFEHPPQERLDIPTLGFFAAFLLSVLTARPNLSPTSNGRSLKPYLLMSLIWAGALALLFMFPASRLHVAVLCMNSLLAGFLFRRTATAMQALVFCAPCLVIAAVSIIQRNIVEMTLTALGVGGVAGVLLGMAFTAQNTLGVARRVFLIYPVCAILLALVQIDRLSTFWRAAVSESWSDYREPLARSLASVAEEISHEFSKEQLISYLRGPAVRLAELSELAENIDFALIGSDRTVYWISAPRGFRYPTMLVTPGLFPWESGRPRQLRMSASPSTLNSESTPAIMTPIRLGSETLWLYTAFDNDYSALLVRKTAQPFLLSYCLASGLAAGGVGLLLFAEISRRVGRAMRALRAAIAAFEQRAAFDDTPEPVPNPVPLVVRSFERLSHIVQERTMRLEAENAETMGLAAAAVAEIRHHVDQISAALADFSRRDSSLSDTEASLGLLSILIRNERKIVAALFLLARCELGTAELANGRFDLGELLSDTELDLAAHAGLRGIRLALVPLEDLSVQAPESLLIYGTWCFLYSLIESASQRSVLTLAIEGADPVITLMASMTASPSNTEKAVLARLIGGRLLQRCGIDVAPSVTTNLSQTHGALF